MCLLELSLIGARYNKLDARIMFLIQGIMYSLYLCFNSNYLSYSIYLSKQTKNKHINIIHSYFYYIDVCIYRIQLTEKNMHFFLTQGKFKRQQKPRVYYLILQITWRDGMYEQVYQLSLHVELQQRVIFFMDILSTHDQIERQNSIYCVEYSV